MLGQLWDLRADKHVRKIRSHPVLCCQVDENRIVRHVPTVTLTITVIPPSGLGQLPRHPCTLTSILFQRREGWIRELLGLARTAASTQEDRRYIQLYHFQQEDAETSLIVVCRHDTRPQVRRYQDGHRYGGFARHSDLRRKHANQVRSLFNSYSPSTLIPKLTHASGVVSRWRDLRGEYARTWSIDFNDKGYLVGIDVQLAVWRFRSR